MTEDMFQVIWFWEPVACCIDFSRAKRGMVWPAVTSSEHFRGYGYPFLTFGSAKRGMIEIHPHSALGKLAEVKIRLPYKMLKTRIH
jgi:hypothetical protein